MSAAPKQLVDIYRQLTEVFSSHKAISITPTKGDPPDRYEITYNIKGLIKPEGGNVAETTVHVVELVIPFGFPHFPPTCKPKSDIFHPDFDLEVICLGDFWHQNCSLPDLIVFIGQMINGEVYSRTNAFNEEACLWYDKHSDAFPLSKIVWHERESAQVSENIDIDTLDESDLSTEFDFLAIEENETGDSKPDHSPATASVPAYDPDLINLLEKQKRYFALYENLKNTGSDKLPEEVRRQFREAEENIRKAEDLFRESQIWENQGDARSALAAFNKIAGYTHDFPDVEVHVTRLRETLAVRKANEERAHPAVPAIDELAKDDKVSAPNTGKKIKRSQPAGKKAHILPTLKWNNKIFCYLLSGCSAAMLAGCAYYYWTTSAKLDSAEAALTHCAALLEKNQFEDAKQSCEAARTASDGITIFHQEKVKQLRMKVGKILQSERMNEGLKGMVLVDGKYHARKDAELLGLFRQIHKEAEEFFFQEDWQLATERFARILAMLETPHIIPVDVVADAEAKHATARFRLLYDSGMRTLQDGKWQEAITELTKAEELLSLLPENDRHHYQNELKNALARSTFEQYRNQGDLSFAKSEWREAIDAYEIALSIPGTEALPKEPYDMVQRNIKRAQLFHLIDDGIKAMGAGAWDDAIGEYRRAEQFLAGHQAYLNVADTEKSKKKLSRIILQASIVRNCQVAADHLEKNELVAAGNIYRQLIDQIDKSPFSGEGEFLTHRKEFAATIQTLDEKIFLAEKSRYLENEYRLLFAANYPTAIADKLVKPLITFTKDTGDKVVFKMQCTETGGGRPLTLVMYYAFEKKTGEWELYSEQQ